MKSVLGGERIRAVARKRAEEEQLPDYEEEVIRVVEGRKQQPNLSFFAFTATPKYKTIQVFGQTDAAAGPHAEPQPFHEYSMRQANGSGVLKRFGGSGGNRPCRRLHTTPLRSRLGNRSLISEHLPSRARQQAVPVLT